MAVSSSPYDPARLDDKKQSLLLCRGSTAAPSVSEQKDTASPSKDHEREYPKSTVGIQKMACRALPLSLGLSSTCPESTGEEVPPGSFTETSVAARDMRASSSAEGYHGLRAPNGYGEVVPSTPFEGSPEVFKGSSSCNRTDRYTSHEEFDIGHTVYEPELEPEAVQNPFEDPSLLTYGEPLWNPLPKWVFIRSSTSLPTYHLGPNDLLHGSSKLRQSTSVDEETCAEDSGDEWWEWWEVQEEDEAKEIAEAVLVYQ
ncbi:hypothetical protein VMCG_00659 [Cytospora schulzeri]|uniref:Uncharacterized protein n=1 Tax=Cytospora schulzeri TaxID=448051 RepID=A0A423X9N3_9PEZI|nr:hypothetical protein VMCG_00659 [Valsa malicola]